MCVLHPKWLENMLGAVNVERLARNTMNKFTKDLKVDVAVDKPCPWGVNRFLRNNHVETRIITSPFRIQIQSRSEPGIVR